MENLYFPHSILRRIVTLSFGKSGYCNIERLKLKLFKLNRHPSLKLNRHPSMKVKAIWRLRNFKKMFWINQKSRKRKMNISWFERIIRHGNYQRQKRKESNRWGHQLRPEMGTWSGSSRGQKSIWDRLEVASVASSME